MIKIVTDPIDSAAVLRAVESTQAGASVLFVGSTRQYTGEQETLTLFYECYETMAVKQLARLRDQAQERWPIVHCAIVHRVGEVALGETSVAVAVSAPHRVASFEAAQWLMDSLKRDVPIWKREVWADGREEWVHPEGSLPLPPGSGLKNSASATTDSPEAKQ